MPKFIVKAKKTKTFKKSVLEAQGLRWVDFVISIETWEKFKELKCQTEKPSQILTKMIEEAIR